MNDRDPFPPLLISTISDTGKSSPSSLPPISLAISDNNNFFLFRRSILS